jgi:hypothetical protein
MNCYSMLLSLFRDIRERSSKIWTDVIYPLRCVKYGLINLWLYLPVIWFDRDWDHAFLLALWEFKFRRMAEYHTRHGHSTSSSSRAAELRLAAALCKRIHEDAYADIPQAQHNAKWGKTHVEHIPHSWDKDGRLLTTAVAISKEKAVTEAEIKLEAEEFARLFKKENAQKDADVVYLSNMIRKRLLDWWD